jgi:large subunit ribosomal protein L6
VSRVGKKPVPIPAGVEVTKSGDTISVTGPRGTLQRSLHRAMKVEVGAGNITVERPTNQPLHRGLHGVTRSVIANMVEGVTQGFQKQLTVVGTGYRAVVSGGRLTLNVGFSHQVEIVPPEGVTIEAPSPTSIIVKGYDKEAVGQVAANIRKVKPPEPYHGKGIRYTGEKVRHKAGKTAK